MEYNELKKELELSKLEIESWHLFYESFTEHDMQIEFGRCILVRMFSELYKAKAKNPTNENILKTENSVTNLEKVFDKMEGLNNRCVKLQKLLRIKSTECLQKDEQIEKLTKEIEAMKLAFNND